jgi:hypothetical protein
MCRRANPDEETTDWRAVCGKTASTVRRAGRARALSDPYANPALARLALAGAYFLTRRKPQTTLCTLSTGGRRHVELLQRRQGGEGNRIERALVIGAKALVPARLVAVRMPEPSVNERRRGAQKQAQQKGSRPSQSSSREI